MIDWPGRRTCALDVDPWSESVHRCRALTSLRNMEADGTIPGIPWEKLWPPPKRKKRKKPTQEKLL